VAFFCKLNDLGTMISLSGLLGIQHAVTDSIVWDAGVEIGMNKAAPDFRLTIGLTLIFKP
jgi:hypothetical protein